MAKKKPAAHPAPPKTDPNAPESAGNKQVLAAELPDPAPGREIKFARTHPDFAYHCGEKTTGLTAEQAAFLVEGGFATYTDEADPTDETEE